MSLATELRCDEQLNYKLFLCAKKAHLPMKPKAKLELLFLERLRRITVIEGRSN